MRETKLKLQLSSSDTERALNALKTPKNITKEIGIGTKAILEDLIETASKDFVTIDDFYYLELISELIHCGKDLEKL